jgi:hypothetical protein
MNFIKKQYNKIKSYFNNQDHEQKLTVFTNFMSDSFRVIMASLLAIFVPQKCSINESSRDVFNLMFDNEYHYLSNQMNGTMTTYHICTMNENFSNLIDYNSFVIAFNFFTLFGFMYLYRIELKREKWMITHLEYDSTKGNENILTLKKDYPDIMDKLQILNKQYVKAYKLIRILYIFNFIFSAILVLNYYYFSYQTATVLVTNTILCWGKIKNGLKLATDSLDKEYAYSYFNIKHLCFNNIDPKFKKTDMSIEIDIDTLVVKKQFI